MTRLADRWRLVVLLALLVTQAPLFAQDDVVFLTNFGFEQRMIGDSWAPVTVWVSSPEKAVDGVVSLSYTQSGSQNAVIRAPFATTPGQTTPVELLACIPQYCSEVTVTVAPRGGRARTTRYVQNPMPEEARLPRLLLPGSLALQVGDSSFSSISAGEDERSIQINEELTGQPWVGRGRNAAPDEHEFWLDYMTISRIRPNTLPRSWAAYDGLMLVAVGGDDAAMADPLELDQLHRWVRSGGRLAVQVGATEDWRMWLPPEARTLVDAAPLLSDDAPGELASLLEHGAQVLDTDLPRVGEQIPSRTLALSREAFTRGWMTRWRNPDNGRESGLIAEGPVGFGWVTLVGVDPKRVTETVSNASAGVLWRDAIRTATADLREQIDREYFVGYGYPYSTRQSAMIASLSTLADMPPVGDGVFFLIVLGVALMALLMGPFDALVLKRLRQRHRSWLTALLWIAIASALAYAAPALLRDGDTRLNTLEVVDLLPAERSAGTPGYATRLTGVFASRSGRMQFTDIPQASLWRGASALMEYETGGGLSWSLVTSQSARRDESGWPRGNPIDAMGMSIWTFRTFQSHGPATIPLSALQIEPTLGDWPRVIVRNLPEGARIKSALLQTAQGWMPLASPSPYQDGVSMEAVSRFPLPGPPEIWTPASATARRTYWNSYEESFHPALAFELTGPSARTQSIEHVVAHGDFACVYLELEDLPSTFGIDGWETVGAHKSIVRALVRLDEPARDSQSFEDAPPIGGP